jgi:hypothetical protein
VAAKIDYNIYDRYVGQYKLGRNQAAVFTITREGDHLFVRLTGQEAIEIFPESKTEFFCTVVDAQITLETNETGAAVALILHQNGLDQKARKFK